MLIPLIAIADEIPKLFLRFNLFHKKSDLNFKKKICDSKSSYGDGDDPFLVGKEFKASSSIKFRKIKKEFLKRCFCPIERKLLSPFGSLFPSYNSKWGIVRVAKDLNDILRDIDFEVIREVYASWDARHYEEPIFGVKLSENDPPDVLDGDLAVYKKYRTPYYKNLFNYAKKYPFLGYKKGIVMSVELYKALNYDCYYVFIEHSCTHHYAEYSSDYSEYFFIPLKTEKEPADQQIFTFLKKNWKWIMQKELKDNFDINIYYYYDFCSDLK